MDLKNLWSQQIQAMQPLIFPEPAFPVRYDFDQGMVAEEILPYELLKQMMQDVLDEDAGEALQYVSYRAPDYGQNATQYRYRYPELMLGYTSLRDELARWITTRQSVHGLSHENFLVSSGVSSLFPLIASAFINPGEAVLMESMTLGPAEKAFRMAGASIHKIEIDEDGLVITALERELEALKRAGIHPKLLYTIATFHLPTGAVLSEQRRHQLLALAEKWQLLVVEDGVYAEMRYDGTPVPSLLSLDRSGLVMQLHGFAKILAPGIRLGWLCAHPRLIEALSTARCDFGVSQWMCRAMAKFMAGNHLEPHIAKNNDLCRRKRDHAVALVRQYCGKWVDFTPPLGGMYLWLKMHETVDWDRALAGAIQSGVQMRPGQRFREDGARYLRLAFCHAGFDELEGGIRALGQAIAGAAK